MRRAWLLGAALIAAGLGACGRERTLDCEPTERYSGAGSAPPVRIPDDLSPPDESESLRLPPPPVDASASAATSGCLESPPRFFEGGPGQGRPAENRGSEAAESAPADPGAGADREISP
jgi:hypothetical protein